MKQSQQSDKNKKPFYKLWWVITLAMIFLTPLGIFLWFKFTKKPHKVIKAVVSVIALIIWITALAQEVTGYSQTFDIDGKQVTIQCERLCSYVGEYGDSEALKRLASIGVKRVENMPSEATSNTVVISADSEQEGGVVNLILTYENGKLVRIANNDYTSIVYYSTAESEATVAYPARQAIADARAVAEKKQKAEADKKAREEAKKAKEASEAKAKQEAKEKAEADEKAREEKERQEAAARAPSAGGTAELCEKQFHRNYPYSGSKVHSILGVIANDNYSANSRLYKVEVTIENAYGASYKAVMECIVRKSGDNMIQVKTFNVY